MNDRGKILSPMNSKNSNHNYVIFILFQVYKQQVKHIMYQNQCKEADLKKENLRLLQEAVLKHEHDEVALRNENRDLQCQIREQEAAHRQSLQTLNMVNHQQFFFYKNIVPLIRSPSLCSQN